MLGVGARTQICSVLVVQELQWPRTATRTTLEWLRMRSGLLPNWTGQRRGMRDSGKERKWGCSKLSPFPSHESPHRLSLGIMPGSLPAREVGTIAQPVSSLSRDPCCVYLNPWVRTADSADSALLPAQVYLVCPSTETKRITLGRLWTWGNVT